MSNSDPERLSSLRNAPELSETMHAARERLPDANALEALRTRIEAVVAPPAPPTAVAAAATPAALKLVLALLVVTGAAVTAQRLAQRAEIPALPAAAPSANVVAAPLPPPRLPAPAVEAAASANAPSLPRATSTVPAAAARPSMAPSAASAPSPAAAGVTSELELVKRAGQLLKSDPAQAFRLTTDHARLYPSGALAEEREVIAIDALASLGRASAARSRAERFMASYPRSAHLSRVQHAIQLDSNDSESELRNISPPSTVNE